MLAAHPRTPGHVALPAAPWPVLLALCFRALPVDTPIMPDSLSAQWFRTPGQHSQAYFELLASSSSRRGAHVPGFWEAKMGREGTTRDVRLRLYQGCSHCQGSLHIAGVYAARQRTVQKVPYLFDVLQLLHRSIEQLTPAVLCSMQNPDCLHHSGPSPDSRSAAILPIQAVPMLSLAAVSWHTWGSGKTILTPKCVL